jgi:mRNA guanylyltransferase
MSVLTTLQFLPKPDLSLNSLKWKPPSENSIDFKLVLRFPPLSGSPEKPDFYAKPIFALHVWCGGEGANANYEPWDTMHVSDDEWETYVVNCARSFASKAK